MWALGIIKVEITTNRCARFSDAVVGFQIPLLIFDAAPQPLDEHVVPPSPFAVHADCNAVVGEHAGEGRPRELRTWSVLEISGLPCFAKASCSVSTQNAASIVIDTRHDRTRRLNQSSTTAR